MPIKCKEVSKENEEVIRSYLTYKNGRVYWSADRGARARAGTRAGSQRKDGYRTIGINGQPIMEHRIIWFLVNGVWPEYIDHVDGNRHNNQIYNLRDVSHKENMQNLKKQKVSKEAKRKLPMGIHLTKSGQYSANIYIGKYDTEAEARAKQIKALKLLGIYR